MHLGRLRNEDFIKAYKQLGFTTITQLVDAACDDLRLKIAKEKRAQWRQKAHEDYAKSNPEYLWEELDGEDFEND